MKEVLTKSFWQGVKKTFHEALKGPRPEDSASQAPAEANPKTPVASETRSSRAATNEQH
jgi:hypothetical protein